MEKLIHRTRQFFIAFGILFVFTNTARLIAAMAEDVSNDIFTLFTFGLTTLFILSLCATIVYLVLPKKKK